jgi:hypothetical protein
MTSVFVDAATRRDVLQRFGTLAQQILNVKMKKGESPSARPFLLKDFQCCAEPTRSCFIRLTSTRPPLVCFAMVPSALAAGELPMLIT